MTSELRVDNLKGSTTGGSINVLGEGTSATTNLQQGLAKVFLDYDQSSDAIDKSFNVSTVTDNEEGKFLVKLAAENESSKPGASKQNRESFLTIS